MAKKKPKPARKTKSAKAPAVVPERKEEALLWKQGSVFVFGIDEAGRGCLAGPVCAAVSCWPYTTEMKKLPVAVRDSKQMTEAEREAAFQPVTAGALAHGVGFASAKEIDHWNILRATHLAVARALERALASLVNQGQIEIGKIDGALFGFLVDGNQPMIRKTQVFATHPDYAPEFPLLRELLMGEFREFCVVGGDATVFAIASASVLAKVSRDRLMLELHEQFPHYEFRQHKGYSTPQHIENLNRAGPCSEHRFSFAPVTEAFQLRSQA